MIGDMLVGPHPIFNSEARKKDKKYRMTPSGTNIRERVERASAEAWAHLKQCVIEQAGSRITKGIRVAAMALSADGEVELEDDGSVAAVGSARVGLIDCAWLGLEVSDQVANHSFFKAEEASGQVFFQGSTAVS